MASKSELSPERGLLNFLVKGKLLDRGKADKVADRAERDALSMIEALAIEVNFDEATLAENLASKLGLPLFEAGAVEPADGLDGYFDEVFANRTVVVPVGVEGEHLIVAMANPLDRETIRHIEFRTGFRVRPAVAPRSAVLAAISDLYKFDRHVSRLGDDGEFAVEHDETADEVEEEVDEARAEDLTRRAEEPPIVKLVNLILGEALKIQASDIHIEPGRKVVRVRYRVNGILQDAVKVARWALQPIVARIKVMSGLDITERRTPQDGHVRVRSGERVVDLRISTLPSSHGETVVLRVLDPTAALRELEQIGLTRGNLKILDRGITRPQGLVLVTGPTGSGKTTTLYAILQKLNSSERKIVTIEDPIEYEIPGIQQVGVNEKQGLTFASVLRSVLRQDPDVVFVGEIRDLETAEVAFQAGQTGHLVLSTLHTNDTTATITRLLDLGVESFLVASGLICVVAQRLVRVNCPECSEPAKLARETAKSLGIRDAKLLRRGEGCPTCRNTGYSTRTGCYELLEVTKRVQQQIASRAPEAALRMLARQEGMTTLVEDAVSKIEQGLTTPEEVRRVISLERRDVECPKCSKNVEDFYRYCPFCLFELQVLCRGCEQMLQPGWKACPYCNTAIEEDREVEIPARDPEAITP